MSRSVQRWERQRAAWLVGHSSAHGGPASATMRRRAEILERSARRSERSGAGITATAVQDEISPGLWHRLTHDGDGSRHHRPRWALAALVVAVFAGPGLLVGHVVYRALWRRSPSIGRLWAWPWAAAATAGAVALAVLGVGFRPAPHLDRHFPLTLIHLGPWWALLVWQLVIAGVTVAALVALWGWRGVPAKAVGAPIKNADGTFREITDDEVLDLDPWKGRRAESSAPQPAPGPESAYERWEAEQQREADLAAIYGEEVPDAGDDTDDDYDTDDQEDYR